MIFFKIIFFNNNEEKIMEQVQEIPLNKLEEGASYAFEFYFKEPKWIPRFLWEKIIKSMFKISKE